MVINVVFEDASHPFRHGLALPGISLSLASTFSFLLGFFRVLSGSFGFYGSNEHLVLKKGGVREEMDCGDVRVHR